LGHGFAGLWAVRGIVVRGRLSCPDGGGAKQNCPIAILYTPSVLPDIFPARGEIERSSAFAKLHRRRSGGGVETADLPPCGYVILMLRWSTPTPSRLRRDTSPPIDGVEERRQAFCRQRSSSNAPFLSLRRGERWRCEAATDWGNHVAIKPRADQSRQSQKICA